jgi:beta-xylosidase
MKQAINPIIYSDFPDPDVICVNNAFYMVSTTMHFMPCCVILKSYNLVDWEIINYVNPFHDENQSTKLQDNNGIYAKGMWAACIRYHNGLFYILFIANDT